MANPTAAEPAWLPPAAFNSLRSWMACFSGSLELETRIQLNSSGRADAVYRAKCAVCYFVVGISQPHVVQGVECLCPQGEVEPFIKMEALPQRGIQVRLRRSAESVLADRAGAIRSACGIDG